MKEGRSAVIAGRTSLTTNTHFSSTSFLVFLAKRAQPTLLRTESVLSFLALEPLLALATLKFSNLMHCYGARGEAIVNWYLVLSEV